MTRVRLIALMRKARLHVLVLGLGWIAAICGSAIAQDPDIQKLIDEAEQRNATTGSLKELSSVSPNFIDLGLEKSIQHITGLFSKMQVATAKYEPLFVDGSYSINPDHIVISIYTIARTGVPNTDSDCASEQEKILNLVRDYSPLGQYKRYDFAENFLSKSENSSSLTDPTPPSLMGRSYWAVRRALTFKLVVLSNDRRSELQHCFAPLVPGIH